jgi:hypothetical protein
MATTFSDRFSTYFDRPVSQAAAKSLVDGAEIQFQILDSERKPLETLTFTKKDRKNCVVPGPASKPQLTFELTQAAAESILNDASDDIGAIGVNIAKLIISQDPEKKASIHLKTGFLGLFSQGYLGVIAAGGGAFAAFLASRGLSGMSGIKEALKKLKS